ncbi:hypothetical protein D3C81_1949940 [compost metagenome]
MYLQAALQQVKGGQEIVLSGKPDDPVLHEMIAAVQRSYSPGSVLVVNYLGPDGEPLRQLLPHLGDKAAINGQATAYICESFACQAPITTLEALKEELKNS